MGLNRYAEAKSVIGESQAPGSSFTGPRDAYEIAFMQHDASEMQRILSVPETQGLRRMLLLLFEAEGEYSQGKIGAARQTFAETMNLGTRIGANEFNGGVLVSEAAFEAELGYSTPAGPIVAKAFTMAKDRDTRDTAMDLLARSGDASGAEKMASELAREFPNDTMLISTWIPIARAFIELRRNNGSKAVALLEDARHYEMGQGPNSSNFWPNYVRAEAYLTAHDGAHAAAEYQKILDHQGVEAVSPLYFLSHLGLGRAYVLQGDKARARTAYQDFFADFKDADPDVPVLTRAKAEYAKLQ
jgi:tetratricopeptide (TPR) repeat protein